MMAGMLPTPPPQGRPLTLPLLRYVKRRRLAWGIAVCLWASLHINAQQPPDKTFEIHASVNRILVEVVVRDKQGRVVNDLKRQDFLVEENGKQRALSAFLVKDRHVSVMAGGSESTRGLASTPTAADVAGTSTVMRPRFILFLFDDLHLSVDDMAHAKASASKLLEGSLGNADMGAVVTLSGSINSGLTRDRKVLQQALAGLKPRPVFQMKGSDCPDISDYQADQIQNRHDSVALQSATQQVFSCSPGLNPQRDYDVAQRTAESAAMRVLNRSALEVYQTFSAIGEYVRRMGKLPAGEKLVVLVSSGFLSITQEAMDEASQVIDLAANANVTVSALDARGLYTTNLNASEASLGSGRQVRLQDESRRNTASADENAMTGLAYGTGGNFFHNSNDLDAGFRALTQTPDCVYVLELPLEGIKEDGSYHRLRVKVDRKDVEVQARHGFYVAKASKKKQN